MKKIIFFFILLLFINGCSLFRDDSELFEVPFLETQENIGNSVEKIDKNAQDVRDATNKIEEETGKIDSSTVKAGNIIPDESKSEVDPILNNIRKSTQTIEKKTGEIDKAVLNIEEASSILKKAQIEVKDMESMVKILEKERNNALKERDKAIKDRDNQLHKMLQYLIIACIIGAGLCSIAFIFYGTKFGLTGAAACALILTIAVFVDSYIIYVAIAGGVILTGLVILLIYNAWQQNKVSNELVDTVEIAQDNMSPEAKEKVFGGEGENGLMNDIQSKATMNTVKKRKQKISNLWEYAKNTKNT